MILVILKSTMWVNSFPINSSNIIPLAAVLEGSKIINKIPNKKQEARRKKKIEQEKLAGKSLFIFEMGAWKTIALPPPKKLSGISVLLSQMKLRSKQFNIEFWKKKARSSASSIKYRVQKTSKILSASSIKYRVQKTRKIL